jgi:anti-anti-sigma regulatory factor
MKTKPTSPTSERKSTAQKTTPRKPRTNSAKNSPATKYGELKLDSLLRIDGVVALKENLNCLLTDPTSLTIDASGIEKTDTSALQLLTAFSLAAARRNIEIHWLKPSESFLQAARLLGLEAPLNLANKQQRRSE